MTQNSASLIDVKPAGRPMYEEETLASLETERVDLGRGPIFGKMEDPAPKSLGPRSKSTSIANWLD
jgi:hypothetical protein